MIAFVTPASFISNAPLQTDTPTSYFPTPAATGVPVRYTPIATIADLDPSEALVSLAQDHVYQGDPEEDAIMELCCDEQHLRNNASL